MAELERNRPQWIQNPARDLSPQFRLRGRLRGKAAQHTRVTKRTALTNAVAIDDRDLLSGHLQIARAAHADNARTDHNRATLNEIAHTLHLRTARVATGSACDNNAVITRHSSSNVRNAS